MMNSSTTTLDRPQMTGLSSFGQTGSENPNSAAASGLQMMALSSGEFHGMLMRNFSESYLEAGKDRRLFASKQIECIREFGLINKEEQRTLEQVLDLAIAVDKSKGQNTETVQKLRQIYDGLVASNGSEAAIANVGIAVNSVNHAVQWFKENPNSGPMAAKGPAESDVEGGLWGTAGGAAGGSVIPGVGTLAGGLLGGIYGAAAGSLVWALDEL